MKRSMLVLVLAGCAAAGTAEEFTWAVDVPKAVDKGSEFMFTVRSTRPTGEAVPGVTYRYQIHWPAGSANPLRHKGATGEPEKVKARLAPGTATMVVTCVNRQGLDVKVGETTFEVK
jgi:hypothetical protein